MSNKFIEVEHGVFRLIDTEQGTDVVQLNGEPLYRFMDNLYIRQQHLHLLNPKEVTNLCRARSNNPQLIGGANARVKEIFLRFLERTTPRVVFEIGAGKLPLISTAQPEMTYILSDADPAAGEDISNESSFCVFSCSDYKLEYDDDYFDVVVAVFVFQFRVYTRQIEELYRCITHDGVIIANVYRRPQDARIELINEFKAAGFLVSVLSDPEELCKIHEYWVIGKNEERNAHVIEQIKSIISSDHDSSPHSEST